jgi:hypothetical protein
MKEDSRPKTSTRKGLMTRPATEQIPDSSIRTFANAYFGTGETLFNIISGTVVSSSYFEQKLQGTGPVYGERKTGL